MFVRLWRSLLLVGLLVGSVACSDQSFVERITFLNDTDYPARVEVSDTERDRWLQIGTARARDLSSVGRIIDQGDVWVFRFDYVGRHQVEITLDRRQLEENNWQVEVPRSFAEELERQGVIPPP